MATEFDAWLGKTRDTDAFIDPWNAKALAAVLDLNAPDYGDQLPGLWHWLYFLETAPRSRIGHDGHPQKGDFLPPVPNPRRMFAGARTNYSKPLTIGDKARLTETVVNIQQKEGSQGVMYIVTVRFDYAQHGELCISEERDFIYLPPVPKPTSPKPLPESVTPIAAAPWSLDFPTDPVLLFRFSAMTFNSHRIHYDLDYAGKEEGYPALVVHGPMTAMLLSECVRINAGRAIKSFSFKALSPLFCGQTTRIRAQEPVDNAVEVVAYTPTGDVAVKARVVLA